MKVVLLSYTNRTAMIDVHVSHGTYVRSLMNDIAQKMGTVGTTVMLERRAIGSWQIEMAHIIDEIISYDQLIKQITPVENFINNL